MIWIHYFFEGKALIIWGILLLIAIGCTELLFKFMSNLESLKIYINEIILIVFALLLLMRGILFSASLATIAGILFLFIGTGIIFLIRKYNLKLSNWLYWLIGITFIIMGFGFKTFDMLLMGILYLLLVTVNTLLKKNYLGNLLVLSGLLILVGIGLLFTAQVRLRAPFVETAKGTITLKKKGAVLKVGANPNSVIEVWKNNDRKYQLEDTTDNYGETSIKFYNPGNYILKTRKNGNVATKKVRVKASKEYLRYKAHEKLLENNKKEIKAKFEITSKDLTWNRNNDSYGYYVNIEGITSPDAIVTVDGDGNNSGRADKNGKFSLKYESYDNEEEQITINVINKTKTRENSLKLKIKENEELKKQEEEEKEKNSTNENLNNENSRDDKYENSSALKVAVEGYVLDHHSGAEVDPDNYTIQKISSGMYEILGSYDDVNGVKHHYDAIALDDGDKVEVLKLENNEDE